KHLAALRTTALPPIISAAGAFAPVQRSSNAAGWKVPGGKILQILIRRPIIKATRFKTSGRRLRGHEEVGAVLFFRFAVFFVPARSTVAIPAPISSEGLAPWVRRSPPAWSW